MKKSFKKAIAVLVSALMIMTSFPFTVFAATDENVNIDLTGSYVGITAANANRYGASGQTAQLNVVNDRQDDNFTIGYINIDISAYAGKKFKSFPLTLGKRENSLDDCQGLKIWYANNSNADGYTTNGRIANSSSVTGTENGHLEKAKTYYGLQEIASFTKAQFDAGTMSFDAADAANARLQAGATRLVIMITQAQSGGKADAGGWTDTWVTFNKAQTCSAVLTTSGTTTGSLSNTGTGLVVAGSESRWANNQFNIVNDQEANNTSAGILKFNVSGLKGKKVDSAKINYTIDSWGDDSTGLVFYYTTSATPATYINGGETLNTGLSCGAGTTANNSFAIALGFSTSDTFANPQKSGTIATLPYNTDIATALQKVADSDKSTLYVIVMQQTAGGKSGSPWSDTKVSPAKITIDYTVSDKNHTRDDVADAKKNLTDTRLNAAPYSGTMTSTQDGSYSKSSLTGGDEMLNVLYSYGVSGSSAYSDWGDSNYFREGLQYGDITLLWDGVNTMACPINIWGTRTTGIASSGGNSDYQSFYIRGDGYTDNTAVYLNHKWHTGTTPTAVGYKTGTDYQVDYIDGNGSYNAHATEKNQTDYYSNTLYVNGSKLGFGTTDKRKTLTLWGKAYFRGNGTRDVTKYKDHNGGFNHASIRVINYAPVANAIRTGKQIFNKVKNDELSYCPDDLYNFYTALDKLTAFNPNNYFAYNNNGYAACCDALAELDTYISTASTEPQKSTITYEHSYTDGQPRSTANVHNGVCQDCDEVISEEACTWNAGEEITPATCTSAGTTKYTCTKCGGTATESIEANGHDTEGQAWTFFTGDPKHYKQCKTCLEWVENEAHNYVEVEGTAVTPDFKHTGKNADQECTGCHNVITGATIEMTTPDMDAYEGLLTTVVTLVEDAYTPESWADLQKALTDAATKVEDALVQKDIDDAASMIQTAINALEPASTELTVTVNVEVDGEVVDTLTYTAEYGDTVSIDVTNTLNGASIQKWTIEQKKAISKLSMVNPVYDMVVTANATVTIIATANKTDDPAYTKVKFTDRGYKTIGYGYVENTAQINVADVKPLENANIVAPTIAFYQFAGWEEVARNVYVATYEVTAHNVCNVKTDVDTIEINGTKSDLVDYDTNIEITYTGTKQLGIKIGGKVMPITDLANVHAPYGYEMIDIVEIDDELAPTSMITGKFTRDVDAGKKIAAFNAMYYLPEGCTLVECGVYAKKGETFDVSTLNTATKVRSQSQSSNNEYTISMQSNYAADGVTKVYGMSYVTYKTAGGEINTAYGDLAVINV